MAQDIVNANQNLSYTNLDFSSIYTEVLDMVKQLTKNWDPSISDESDPGVVLVKLSALLADKMNYNIDKNILEAFPLSVTQESNARQMYEQLGYYMNWYRAATVPVSLSWKTDTVNTDGEILSYTIPKFTTITDENETVVYSLVGTESYDEIVVSDGLLYTDSSKNLNMIAYEGIPVQYTFNDRTVITPNMVDNHNRLYLTTAYAFENGVFIKNVDQDNYAEWHRVNNLYEYSYDVHRYKFGYDSASNLCYLEFPDNYAELFGSGIEIVYLTFSTNESYADVPTQYLSKFLVALTVGENGEITLNAENVNISNTEPATGHADKEGIDEAYTNYKKVVGTFKTLITLRDYLNYIRSKEVDICSNAVVTDRTNDVQSTYKIVNKHNDVDAIVTEVEKSFDNFTFKKVTDDDIYPDKTYYQLNSGDFEVVANPDVSQINSYYEREGEEVLSPFSLKFYLLQKAVALTNRLAYDSSFELSTDNFDLDTLLEDTSHLVHNFEDIEPIGVGVYVKTTDETVPTDSSGVPTKIYYRYDSELGRYAPVSVNSMDYTNYSPSAMGLYEEETNYYRTQDTVWNASRVYYYHTPVDEEEPYKIFEDRELYANVMPKNVDYIWVDSQTGDTYTSFIYTESLEYVKTKDGPPPMPGKDYYVYDADTQSYVLADLPDPQVEDANPEHLGLYEQIEEPLLPHIVMFKNKYPITMNISTYNSVSTAVKQDILSNILSAFYKNLDSSNVEFGDNISLDYLTRIVLDADARIKNVAFEALTYTTSAVYWDDYQESFIEIEMPQSISSINLTNIYSNPTYDNITAYMFGKDVICKSILAGVTQLLVPDNVFAYHLNQKLINQGSGIKYITGEAVINMQLQDPYYVINDNSNPQVRRSYTLQENETLTLFKPLVSNVETYTAGVHYEYKIFEQIAKGQSYQLQRGEYFIFYISNLDSDGLLKSFNVYVYGEGAIINPTFDVEVKDKLTTYGDVAVNMLGENAEYISKDTNLYSYVESRGAYVTQINNNSTISNTKIDTNQSINAQTLKVFTINAQDGYRFIWSLNTPTYEGTLKQYKLFDAYNPEDDLELQNISTINSYTLKSGEYLYYTDSTLSNLGVLGAGTTIYRNCGLESDIAMINPQMLSPMVFVKWDDLVDNQYRPEINAQGFDKIVSVGSGGTVGDLLPMENGFYYLDGSTFKRIADNSVRNQDTPWYVMLMKDVSGWYVKNSDSETPVLVSSNTSEIFSAVDLASEYPNQDISPADEDLYERMEYNGVPLQDDYYKPTKSCNNSDEYTRDGKTISKMLTSHRFASALETSVLTSELFTDTSGTTVNTFNPSGDISLSTNADQYSPNLNGWMIHKDGNNDSINPADPLVTATVSDKLFTDALTDIAYDTTITKLTHPRAYYKLNIKDETYYDYDYSVGVPYISMLNTVNMNGDRELLYGNKTYSLSHIFNANISVTSSTTLRDTIDTEWAKNNVISDKVSNWKLNMMSTDNSGDYAKLSIVDFADLSALTSQQKIALKNNLKFGFTNPEGSGDPISLDIYVKSTVDTENLSFGTFGPSTANPLTIGDLQKYSVDESGGNPIWYPLSYTTIKIGGTLYKDGTQVTVSDLENIYDIEPGTELTAYTLDAEGQYSADLVGANLACNIHTNLNNFINGLEALQSQYYTYDSYDIGVCYMPVYYQMRPWVGYINKTFYKLNKYATKSYAQVDPFVCPAVDSLTLSNNPLSVMRTAFQSVQPNTSLTFTQNELHTLSQGDTISFETLDSGSRVMFPTFTNDDVALNLDEYAVSYKRVGNDAVSLDKIRVENCEWRGYSNLLLNTNSANGQKLASNQSIDMYGEDFGYLGSVKGTEDSNIHFQLQYPMSNLSGTFVDVSTSNMVSAELLNRLYAYNISQSTEDYGYSEDTFHTYVYSKKADISGDYTFDPEGIRIEHIKLPAGDYLIPVNGISGIRIELSSIYTDTQNGDVTQPLTSYADNTKTYFLGDKLFFAHLIIAEGTQDYERTLLVRIANPDGTDLSPTNDESITVVLNDIFKFEPNSKLANAGIFDDIKAKVIALDVDHLYDYTHIPSDDDIIPDPLLPKEYWNKNHIANPFTIAQLDADSIDYKFIT